MRKLNKIKERKTMNNIYVIYIVELIIEQICRIASALISADNGKQTILFAISSATGHA
jgi:hypothetical protein